MKIQLTNYWNLLVIPNAKSGPWLDPLDVEGTIALIGEDEIEHIAEKAIESGPYRCIYDRTGQHYAMLTERKQRAMNKAADERARALRVMPDPTTPDKWGVMGRTDENGPYQFLDHQRFDHPLDASKHLLDLATNSL